MQVDPKLTLVDPRLTAVSYSACSLKYAELLSSFAFTFNLRRCTPALVDSDTDAEGMSDGQPGEDGEMPGLVNGSSGSDSQGSEDEEETGRLARRAAARGYRQGLADIGRHVTDIARHNIDRNLNPRLLIYLAFFDAARNFCQALGTAWRAGHGRALE